MTRRFPTLLVTAGSLALAGPAWAQSPTSREMFRPVDNDLALQNLRKLVGCVVDGVWKSSAACTDDRPLTAALAYFNIGCLIVATILACHLLYSMVADTANDGQVFGRSTDTKWTLLRVMAGAILALPVKAGLSLVQILVIQVAVWGSGFADNLWTRVASTQLNGMYGAIPAPQPMRGDFVLRAKIASALQVRIYGYVCKTALEDYATTLTGSASIEPYRETFTNDTGVAVTYTFQDRTGYYGNSSNLCGSVTYDRVKVDPQFLDSKDTSASQRLNALAEQLGQETFGRAMGSINSSASTIAASITNTARDDTAIKRSIKTAIDSAQTATTASITQGNGAQFDSIVKSYLDDSVQNGWLSAILWQRSMSAIYGKMLTAQTSGTIEAIPPSNINRYLPFFTLTAPAFQSIAEKSRRDIAYVGSLDGFFAAQAAADPSLITSDAAGNRVAAAGVTGKLVAMIYEKTFAILSRDPGTQWKDPILEAQEIGQSITYLSMGAAGMAASSSLVAGVGGSIPLVGGLVSTVTGGISGPLWTITTILMVGAFLLTGVAPFILLVHFLLASLNWFLVVVEALIAVPVWLLTKFMPSRGDGFVGRSGQGYLFLLGILLRPALIVVGLLVSLLIMRLGFDLAKLFFRGALGMLSPDGSIASVFVAAAGILTYTVTLFIIVTTSAGLISSLPETVLGWLGGAITRQGMSGAASNVAGTLMPASTASIAGPRAMSMGRSLSSGADGVVQKLKNRLPGPPPKS